MSSRRSRKQESATTRSNPENWGYNPGYFGGGRLTVQSLENEMSAGSGRRRRSRRSSRRKSEDESSVGKRTWIAVAAIVFLYAGFLGFMLVWSKVIRPPAPAPAAEVKPAATTAPAGEEGSAAPDITAAEIIGDLERSKILAEDARRAARGGDLITAEAKFAAAAELAPNVFTLLQEWASVLRENKKWGEAREVLTRAVSMAPDSAGVRLALADTYVQLRRNDDALAMAEWVLEDQPYAEEAHRIVAEISVARGQHEKAMRHWQKLVSLDSNNHSAENNLGVSLMKLNRSEEALKSFNNVIRDEPGNSQAYYYMTQAYMQDERWSEAVATLTRSIDRFGFAFVQAWTMGPEFDPIRDQEAFARLFPSGSSPATN
jgi:tetratricopeptide (TPR) repeat protein